MSDSEQQIRQFIEGIPGRLQKFFPSQQHAQEHLEKALQLLQDTGSPDEESSIRFHDLIFQLRLSNEDALQAFLRFYRSFANVLGIDSRKSELHNLERLRYLVGLDNIKNLLSILTNLISKLMQLKSLSDKNKKEQLSKEKQLQKVLKLLKERLAREASEFESPPAIEEQLSEEELSKEPAEVAEKKRQFKERHRQAIEHELMEAIELQAYFQFSTEQLTEAWHRYEGLPEFGIMHNHIATLEGPVSRFRMSYQHGLQHMAAVTRQFDQAIGFVPAEHLLLSAPQEKLTPQTSLTIKEMASEQLAQTAEARRTLSFFGH